MPLFGAHLQQITSYQVHNDGSAQSVWVGILVRQRPAADEPSVFGRNLGLKTPENQSKASDKKVRATQANPNSTASDRSVRPTRTRYFTTFVPLLLF